MDDTTSSQVHDAQSACNNLFRTSRRVGLHQVKYADNLGPRGVGGQDGKTRPSKIRYLVLVWAVRLEDQRVADLD